MFSVENYQTKLAELRAPLGVDFVPVTFDDIILRSAQDLFDTMASHLLAQGERSVDELKACLYRCDDGKMCAVGVLIPDYKYHSVLEGDTVQSLVVTGPLMNVYSDLHEAYLTPEFEAKKRLLFRMQRAHDACRLEHEQGVMTWREIFASRLWTVANDLNLIYKF